MVVVVGAFDETYLKIYHDVRRPIHYLDEVCLAFNASEPAKIAMSRGGGGGEREREQSRAQVNREQEQAKNAVEMLLMRSSERQEGRA